MTGYYKLRKRALNILRTQLHDQLYYHGFHHTLDVLKVCNDYIRRQKIRGRDAKLLRLGALMHDIGFTVAHKDHEELGVEIARKLMKEYGFGRSDFNTVKALILATKIPQSPGTKYERILCDSDLDYLGKDNFDAISETLFRELKAQGLIKDRAAWDAVQVNFLESHQYHTAYARKYRNAKKQEHLEALRKKISAGEEG